MHLLIRCTFLHCRDRISLLNRSLHVYPVLRSCNVVTARFLPVRPVDVEPSSGHKTAPCKTSHRRAMILSQSSPFEPPAAFAQLVKAGQDDVRHRNTHFTCCTLACRTSSNLVLGTTLGDICVIDSSAACQGRQSFATAVSSSVFGHRGGVNAVCSVNESENTSSIVTCGSDGALKVWNMTGSYGNQGLQHASTLLLNEGFRSTGSGAQAPPSEALCMVFDGDCVLAGTCCGELVHIDLQNGATVQERFPAHTGSVVSVSQNISEGSVLATASEDGSVALWDLRSSHKSSCISRFQPSSHAESKLHAHHTHEGRAVSSMSSVPAWGSVQGDQKQAAAGRPVCCSFDASGSWLAIGCTDSKLRYWSVRMQKITSTLHLDSVPLSMTAHGRDLWVGCSKGTLYAGGFLASSVEAFQRLVVPGRAAVLGLVGMHHDRALAGTVYACCAPGTIHSVNTLGRNAMGTITTYK